MGIFNSIATSNNAVRSISYPKGFMVKMGRIAFKKQDAPQKSEYENFLSDLKNLRPDLSEDFIKEILLDQRVYLEKNPDVKSAKLCPVYHYYNYGYKEEREFCTPNFRAFKRSSDKTGYHKIVFFDTIKSNASFLYRGFFPEIRNEDVNIIHQETDLITAIKAIFSAKEMIFIRPSTHSMRTDFFLGMCNVLNVKISMDFDDLLLPEFTLELGAVRSGISDVANVRDHFVKNSAMLLRTEKLILSTNKLGEVFSGLVDDIVIRKNRLPYEYFRSREELENNHISKNEKINFLYLSGSKTHLKDYSIISGCLLKLAMEHPGKFSMNFLGMVNDQSAIFSNLGIETNFIPFVSFEEMLQEIGKSDLVLVPLENTIFNHAKSNIKFIEAASQAVPVIASKVDEYEEAIDTGVNGWLCENEIEWYETLKSIILNEVNLKEVGLSAYEKAVRSYSI